jgi:aminoglycoside 6'-N-acetyltransferase I
MPKVSSASFESLTSAYLDAAAELYVQVFNAAPWNDGWNKAAARRRLERLVDNPEHVGIAATEAGELLGFASGWLEPWISGAQFHLKELCVAPERQREGLGRRLVGELILRLRSAGVESVYLMTQPHSPAAAFYEALGFQVLPDQCMTCQLAVPGPAAEPSVAADAGPE